MSYFKNINSLSELKRKFREIAKMNHPDAGGDPEIMKAINEEYEKKIVQLKNESVSIKRREEKKKERPVDYDYFAFVDQILNDVKQNIRKYLKENFASCRFVVTEFYTSFRVELLDYPKSMEEKVEQILSTIRKAVKTYTKSYVDLNTGDVFEIERIIVSRKFIRVTKQEEQWTNWSQYCFS